MKKDHIAVKDRQAYCARVLSGLRGLSRREREEVRAELADHMEDHAQALLDLGYDEQLAEERTLASMGDPAEVARELAKQYPRRWRVVTGVSLVLCAFVLFSAFSSSFNRKMAGYAWESIVCRFSPWETEEIAAGMDYLREPYFPVSGVTEAVDIRRDIGDEVLWIYRITVGEQDGRLTAEAAACVYHKIPGGLVSLQAFNELWPESQRGERQVLAHQGTISNPMMYQLLLRAPVQPGDDHITVRYEWMGERVAVDVPLPEGGAS